MQRNNIAKIANEEIVVNISNRKKHNHTTISGSMVQIKSSFSTLLKIHYL